MNLVFLGPPGAGKGTQAKSFAARRGLAHVSTGDMFRAAVSQGTPLGMKAKAYMDKGDLVPDEVVCGIVRERLAQSDCARGFILDGFPRTVPQAEALERDLGALNRAAPSVVDFRLDRADLVRRLTSRLTCRQCGAVYNAITSPPREPGKCDACGGEVVVRNDDRPETVENRLRVYDRETAPLLAFYAGRGRLVVLDASGTPAQVEERLDVHFPGA